jgi:hypothetical protein
MCCCSVVSQSVLKSMFPKPVTSAVTTRVSQGSFSASTMIGAAFALEPYCTQCGAKAGVFIARWSDWRHYAGDPEDGTAEPFDADHAPVIGWRPAEGGAAFVAF